MATSTTLAPAAFDPRSWLAAWADIGGIVIYTGTRLLLNDPLDASDAIYRARAHLLDTLSNPEAKAALRSYLERRQLGEVQRHA